MDGGYQCLTSLLHAQPLLSVVRLTDRSHQMDRVHWSQKRFEECISELFNRGRFNRSRFSDIVPVSAFTGEGITKQPPPLGDWYKGPTLIEALAQLPLEQRTKHCGPLRVAITLKKRIGKVRSVIFERE